MLEFTWIYRRVDLLFVGQGYLVLTKSDTIKIQATLFLAMAGVSRTFIQLQHSDSACYRRASRSETYSRPCRMPVSFV